MIRTIFALPLIGLVATSASAEVASLKTTSVELPQSGDQFSGGDKAEAINNNCLTCHSREMVLMQPVLTKEEWGKEVGKMRKVFGAPVSEKDVPAIVDYLAALKPAH